MKISRKDNLYVEIEKIENISTQYQVFLQMMRFRYFFDHNPVECPDKYIESAQIKNINISEHSLDYDIDIIDTAGTMYANEVELDKLGTNNLCINDAAYFNNPNYTLNVRIDFSLPKEMLMEQISLLKDSIDKDKTIQTVFKKQEEKNRGLQFIPNNPLKFKDIIERHYGDFLFVIDCKELGYKNQYIRNLIYDFRNNETTIGDGTIRKYLRIADEIFKHIGDNQ